MLKYPVIFGIAPNIYGSTRELYGTISRINENAINAYQSGGISGIPGGTDWSAIKLDFAASWCNSLYDSSATVQPLATASYILIRI